MVDMWDWQPPMLFELLVYVRARDREGWGVRRSLFSVGKSCIRGLASAHFRSWMLEVEV
jgi:hypothetical protein